MAIQTDYKEKKISYDKAIDLLIKIGYNTINSKEFLGDNMVRNNLDLAMLITDAILNEFEKNGKLDVPLDEHKYSFDLQDVIQSELEKIANEDMINDNTKSIAEGETLNYMKSYYENKKVKIKGQEIYGKVTREYSSEVLVAVEVSNETSGNEVYFKKSEVEIVDERI